MQGETVTDEVIRPDGEKVLAALQDDGNHQDGSANDGIYAILISGLTEPGVYRFLVTAQGQTRQEGGVSYERSAIGAFEFGSPAARLAGQYSDEGVDEDGDGLFEWLRIDVGVQVNQPGNFTLSARLTDGEGNFIANATASLETTEAGAKTMQLFFDGQTIGNWNYSGQFQLRDVVLLHRTDRGIVTADVHEHPYDTRAYQAAQFPSNLTRRSIALSEGLHFLSVPMQLANPDWANLLGQMPSEVKVATWMQGNYAFYPQEPANWAQVGQGYWVKLKAGQARELHALGRLVSEEQPFSIALSSGWNAIGSPFVQGILWQLDKIQVRKGVEVKTLAQAQQAGWIEDYAWGWEQDKNDPFKGKYVLVYDTSVISGVKGQIEPWQGYWVYAHTD
ncbi:MAG: choice-of-anchor X domain-containing protein, partial [Nitrososphaerota archaeon]